MKIPESTMPSHGMQASTPAGVQPGEDAISHFGRLGRLIDTISMISGTLSGAAMFLISVLTTYDVIMRRFVGRPTTWVFTISLFVLMWFVLMAAPIAIKEDRQIIADFFISRMSGQKQVVLKAVAHLLSMVFIGIVGYYGLLMCREAYQNNFMNIELVEYPKWVLYAVFPVTALIILLQFARNLVSLIRTNFGIASGDRPHWLVDVLPVVSFFVVLAAVGATLFSIKPFLGIIVMVLALLLSGVPAAFALGLSGISALFITQQGFDSLTIVPVVVESTLYNFVLLAIPMFIMGGVVLEKGGIGMRIFDLSAKFMGALPGGLAMATIVACAVVSAMIGVSTAVAAAIGLIAIPQLISRGYSKELAYGSVAGGALGILIPPSAGLIVYGYLTNSSVGVLFASAFVPAFLLVGLFLVYVLILSRRSKTIEKVRSSRKDKLISLKQSILGFMAPVIVLGGIYTGLFTPTEAAGVLVVYSLGVALIYKELTFSNFVAILRESAVLGSAIMMVMVGAMLLSNEVALLRIPRIISQWLVSSGISNPLMIIALMVMYVVLGMFLDGLSITVLTVPVLFPLMPVLGLDVVAFGVVLMIFIEMALITPPVGLNLFMIQAISKDRMWPIARGNLPFALLMFVTAALLLVFPQVALWLPRVLGLM